MQSSFGTAMRTLCQAGRQVEHLAGQVVAGACAGPAGEGLRAPRVHVLTWIQLFHPTDPALSPPCRLQGPTISNVYHRAQDGNGAEHRFYAATICVRKKQLYGAVKALQKVRRAIQYLSNSMYRGCRLRDGV